MVPPSQALAFYPTSHPVCSPPSQARYVLFPLRLPYVLLLSRSNSFSINLRYVLYLRSPRYNRHPSSVRYVTHGSLLRHSLHRRHFNPFHGVPIYCTLSLVCQARHGVDLNIGT